MSTELRLEALLGRRVVDADGRNIGRLEDVIAESHGHELLVREYLVGERGLLSRLSIVTSRSALVLVHLLAGVFTGGRRAGYRVMWDELDLSDPEHPRTLVSRDRLRARERE